MKHAYLHSVMKYDYFRETVYTLCYILIVKMYHTCVYDYNIILWSDIVVTGACVGHGLWSRIEAKGRKILIGNDIEIFM